MAEATTEKTTRSGVPLDLAAHVLEALRVMRGLFNGIGRAPLDEVLTELGVRAQIRFYLCRALRMAALGSPEPAPLVAWWSAASEDETRQMLDRAIAEVDRG